MRDSIIRWLRRYFGREREERETALSPSANIEKNMPFSPYHVQEHFLECEHCKRKILVSVVLFGVSHNGAMTVDCRECLKDKGINPEFVKERPEQAARIQRWLDDALGRSE